jgi:hypothetical protein
MSLADFNTASYPDQRTHDLTPLFRSHMHRLPDLLLAARVTADAVDARPAQIPKAIHHGHPTI